MQENELNYYNNIGNWNFDQIKYKTKKLSDWDFYEKIKENVNEKSICLDLGTGGGEKVLKYYPKVKKIYATDFSDEMIKTAKKNAKEYPNRNIEFLQMDNLQMTFKNESFDLVSARHTIINAKQIYDSLKENGVLIIEGVDKEDCIELKQIFKRGQGFYDEKAISERDYEDLKKAGFKKVKKYKVLEDEFYETKEDLLALLLKTPILDNFSEDNSQEKRKIEKELFEKYIEKNKTNNGILLKRVLYGIVGIK